MVVEYSKLLGRQKQAKLQCLQNPSQMNGGNMDNIRCESSADFRIPPSQKRRDYLKDNEWV
jgi:hypothetical protein